MSGNIFCATTRKTLCGQAAVTPRQHPWQTAVWVMRCVRASQAPRCGGLVASAFA
ncbi:MAG: hypothetical protein JSR65_03710 [Proteobacteria bacterium]|nr:hypothetical protein [Pseudomonadota bacterium]